MRDAGVKGSERECFYSTNYLISQRLMSCDWMFIVMRCCETRGNTDSAETASIVRNRCDVPDGSAVVVSKDYLFCTVNTLKLKGKGL